MLHDSPIRTRHEQWLADLARGTDETAEDARAGAATGSRTSAEVEWLPYGATEDGSEPLCEIPATIGGEVESEYAAIRRGAGLLDAPHRGTVVLRGDDRLDLLDRLVTQAVGDMRIGSVRNAFLLTRKGRIEADLLIAHLSDKTVIDVDISRAASVAEAVDAMIFGEDVEVADVTAETYRISVHGPQAGVVLAELTQPIDVVLDPSSSGRIVVDGAECVVIRQDTTGEVGHEWIVPKDAVAAVWERMLAVDGARFGGRRHVRPIGWYAYNMARVEAGTPLFMVDFATDSLPHETGLLGRRVSFTKGCYPGQEVVARTEHLGRPKQVLVGLVVDGDEEPFAGGQVFARADDGSMGDVIGGVTSSAPSPMRGLEPVALAVVRSKHAEPGRTVLVPAGGEARSAVIGGLDFWTAGSGESATAVARDAAGTAPDASEGDEP